MQQLLSRFSMRTLFVMTLVMAVVALPVSAASYDLGGRTITIGDFFNWGATYKDGDMAEWTQAVEDMFNVNIEFRFIGAGEMIDTVTNGVMAGDPVADVFVVQTWMFDPLAAAGMLAPLDDVLTDEYYNSLPQFQADTVREYGRFGKVQYGFSSNDAMSLSYGIAWNKSLFEREGLPDLYDLQFSGEWTWDVMREIAKQATRDTDGDGVIDQWGFTTAREPHAGDVIQLAYANNAVPYREIDGRVVFTFNEKPALDAIQFMHDLIHVDGSVVPGPDQPTDEATGLNAFIQGKAAMLFTNVDFSSFHLHNSNMSDDYGFVMTPMGPNADRYVAGTEMVTFFVLPRTIEDPEAVVAVTNALFRTTDEYRDMDEWIDDLLESFGSRVRDFESVETRLMMLENTVIGMHPSAPNTGLARTSFWGQVGAALNGEKSPAAAMNEIEPQVQALLDEVFN